MEATYFYEAHVVASHIPKAKKAKIKKASIFKSFILIYLDENLKSYLILIWLG